MSISWIPAAMANFVKQMTVGPLYGKALGAVLIEASKVQAKPIRKDCIESGSLQESFFIHIFLDVWGSLV